MSRPPQGLYTREDWPRIPGATLRRRRFGPDLVELDCDVVVVGSGAGGAVVAAELAEGGLDVIVLEEGGYHPTESFTPDADDAIRRLYRDGGAIMALGAPPVTYSEGRCVGGSTVINGGMTWKTPPRILERWAREDWIDGISPAAMEPVFARVERFLHAAHQDPWTIGRDNALLKEGADKKAWEVVDNVRDQLHCAGTNNCAFGCPTAAKRSTLVTYLPRALHFGARVLANCRVTRLLRERKRVLGVEGRIVRHDARDGLAFQVRAPQVVLAAGAVHTPGILFRSGVRSPSGRLGKNLSLHPNVKVTALFDEEIRGWEGVHQAYQVREFQREGLVFAAVNIPPSIAAMTLPYYGDELREIMDGYSRMLIAGMLLEDTETGVVRDLAGRPQAFYQLSDLDAERLVHGTALLCELLFEVGARRIVLPFEGIPDLRGPEDVRRLYAQKVDKARMEVVTVHIMGTCAAGEDRARHVCDSYGRVYDAEGLVVADASLFPSPIGVNPMETIMALATRNAAAILDGARVPS
ncbi:MAG: GMC family oxidoreductase N-terminal domain-containing protein [Planctomycetota bacterium]